MAKQLTILTTILALTIALSGFMGCGKKAMHKETLEMPEEVVSSLPSETETAYEASGTARDAIREEGLREADLRREAALQREADLRREAALRESPGAGFSDIHFTLDGYSLSLPARELLSDIASWMLKHPGVRLQIEGHCCELGTDEYNLSLGERRAESVRSYLTDLGVDFSSLSTISYGEESPIDPGHYEEARAKNRRAHFVLINQ